MLILLVAGHVRLELLDPRRKGDDLNGAGTGVTLPQLEQLHPALLLRLDDLLLRSVGQVEQPPDPIGHPQAGEVEAQGLVLPADLLLHEGAGLLVVLARFAAPLLLAEGVDDGSVAGDVPAGLLLFDAQLGEAGLELLLGIPTAPGLGDRGAGGADCCRRAEAAAVEVEEETADADGRRRGLCGGAGWWKDGAAATQHSGHRRRGWSAATDQRTTDSDSRRRCHCCHCCWCLGYS
mmetsp:Transcript_30438/g.71278  ORF Transcript_30438/g.71278 Transcript_30438/m.71278 type:complete len:235 (-) Transcript_30438:45-749(-)